MSMPMRHSVRRVHMQQLVAPSDDVVEPTAFHILAQGLGYCATGVRVLGAKHVELSCGKFERMVTKIL